MQTGIYKHYKGGYYLVLGIAQHTERDEKLVIYVSLTGINMPGPRLRARPLDGPEGWNTPVKVNVSTKQLEELYRTLPRFEYVGDELSTVT